MTNDKPTLPKERSKNSVYVDPDASFWQVFFMCVIWFWILLGLLGAELYYLDYLGRNISTDFVDHKSTIKSIVSRYPNEFTPNEVNMTKYNLVTDEIASMSVKMIDRITLQLWYSILSILVIGHVVSIFMGKVAPKVYKGNGHKKDELWISSGSEMSKTISGAVTVGLAIVGAVSFITPQIIGGYVLAALQVLLICIIVGIIAQAYVGGLVVKSIPDEKKVIMNRGYGAVWDGIISAQFTTLMIGIGLLVTQVLIFW